MEMVLVYSQLKRGGAMRYPLFVLCVILPACVYKADVLETPSFSVASSYGEQIPGAWLLNVEAANLDRPTKTNTFACAAHKFPLQMAGSFATWVKQTLDNVVDRIEVVPCPVDANGLRARGARGIIIIRGQEVRPHMEVKPGFWMASTYTQATIIATITVDGPNGRLFGQTVEGQGFATGDAGFACEGGAKALAQAAAQGMGNTMRKIGEAVSNSERVQKCRGLMPSAAWSSSG